MASNKSSKPASPDVAAKELIGVLGDTRTTSAESGNQRDPLGEFVSVNVELIGLRGQPVFLSWSMFQKGGKTRLYGKWLSNFVAYRLVASTDDDTGNVKMWIPLPKEPGPYFVQLSLIADGASLTSTRSGLFG